MKQDDVGGVTTTEVCNITCVMCHFNGPKAPRKQSVLTVEEVVAYLKGIPRGEIWFAATGEFFMDPNALTHLRNAIALGHQPCILTNGLLLTPELIDEVLAIGVRKFHISVDEISPQKYGKIRIGGDLGVILDVCAYLRGKKKQHPDIHVGINVTMFRKTTERQDEFITFWTGKVDQVNFNAEYYDIFKFRNKLFEPDRRNDCHIKVYLLPTGQMSPCCAMTVYQHHHDVPWMPHINDMTPEQALEHFKKLYADPESPLGKLCQNCDWWIMWAIDKEGKSQYPGSSAYLRCVTLPGDATSPESDHNGRLFGGKLSLPLVQKSAPAAAAPVPHKPRRLSHRLRSLAKKVLPASVRQWLRSKGLVPPPRD